MKNYKQQVGLIKECYWSGVTLFALVPMAIKQTWDQAIAGSLVIVGFSLMIYIVYLIIDLDDDDSECNDEDRLT